MQKLKETVDRWSCDDEDDDDLSPHALMPIVLVLSENTCRTESSLRNQGCTNPDFSFLTVEPTVILRARVSSNNRYISISIETVKLCYKCLEIIFLCLCLTQFCEKWSLCFVNKKRTLKFARLESVMSPLHFLSLNIHRNVRITRSIIYFFQHKWCDCGITVFSNFFKFSISIFLSFFSNC